MSSIKHGTISKPPAYTSYWRHLRRFGKRCYWKAERRAAKAFAKREARA